jgi:crossover junction endodeoxyribonuclease RuvC
MTTQTYFMGIDPGLSGAIAIYDGAQALVVHDMPTLQLKTRRVVDEYALARLIDSWSGRVSACWLEQVATRPGEGAVGAFTFGRSYGVVRGVLAANFVTIHDVPPQVWKRVLKVSGDKDEARARASALFPRHAHQWPLKKHDGRAEASLIALYGQQTTLLERVA